MADIFISYARSTAAQAQQIAEALRALGYGVWRDDELPAHRGYAEVIEERLKAAKAVVVIWSAEGVKSEWVAPEADAAREVRKLVQLSVDGVVPADAVRPDPMRGLEWMVWRLDRARLAQGRRQHRRSLGRRFARQARRAAQSERAGISICVLPFANMSNDPEQEYFSDGISEDIITDLSKVSALCGDLAQLGLHLQRQACRSAASRRASSMSAMCSKAACANRATACASPRSSSTAPPTIMSGPSATTATR